MAVVNNCPPTDLGYNVWCLSDLYALGEGTQLIALPTTTWDAIKTRWMNTPVGGSPSSNVLAPKAGANSKEYIFNMPTGADPSSILFPTDASNPAADPEGLFFEGNALIFNPTIGQTMEVDGTPYQTSTFSIPVGSSKDYAELVRYMQSKAWNFIKIDSNTSQMNVYGGVRGYFPTADEVVEMMFSGNNDAKGKATVPFVVEKQAYVIEYLVRGTATTDEQALPKLMGYIKAGACKPNGINTGE